MQHLREACGGTEVQVTGTKVPNAGLHDLRPGVELRAKSAEKPPDQLEVATSGKVSHRFRTFRRHDGGERR